MSHIFQCAFLLAAATLANAAPIISSDGTLELRSDDAIVPKTESSGSYSKEMASTGSTAPAVAAAQVAAPSASVESIAAPPMYDSVNQGLSTGNIVGMSLAFGLFALLILVLITWWAIRGWRRRAAEAKDMRAKENSHQYASRHHGGWALSSRDDRSIKHGDDLSDGEEDAKPIELDFDFKNSSTVSLEVPKRTHDRGSRVLRI